MNKFRKAIMTAAIAAAGAAAFASVGARDAESIAIEHSGVRNARFVHTDRDRDHGRTIWEVEFYDGDREYSYDIDAETGDIIKADWDLDWWDRAGDQISEDDALRMALDDSGISEFYFSYPTALYNAVTVDETAWQSEMGENIQTISFSGSEGSELIFSLSRRTDGLSVKGMTERTASGARGSVTEFEEILNTTKDGYGKLVFTGWTDGSYEKTVYCLVKVEDSYIMSMTVVTPNYKGNQDELHKGYVTECLYRMCGFSDATAPWRSFNEYAEG